MKKALITEDPLFNKSKKQLSTKRAQEIIRGYVKKQGLKKNSPSLYNSEFLSSYYSPILAAMHRHYGSLKGKRMLEIGYRIPMFLDYLNSVGVTTVGIDIAPIFDGENLYKMDIENMPREFKEKYSHKFDVVFERLALSRLYDEMYVLEKGRLRFKNKKLILSNIAALLKPKGLLILQDDRGSIFTMDQLKKAGFEKAMRDAPIILKNKKGEYLGWNTLEVYRKV